MHDKSQNFDVSALANKFHLHLLVIVSESKSVSAHLLKNVRVQYSIAMAIKHMVMAHQQGLVTDRWRLILCHLFLWLVLPINSNICI